MNNKFLFLLLLVKISFQWESCFDSSSLEKATNRVSHTATVVGDDFYLIGGIMNYGQFVKTPNRYIYKVTYNACNYINTELKDASVDIYDHAAVYIPDGEFKDCILIFGGNYVDKKEYESIFYYNISSDSIGNITSAEFTYVGSRAFYLKDLNKVALIGGYNEDLIYNSISYFDLNTKEIESYSDSIGFDPAKRYSFSSSLNEIEDKDGNIHNIITFFGGYNKYNDYTKSLYAYDTTTPTERPLQKHFDGPDLNREYSKGVGWKHYLVFHGGTFYYKNSFYLSERTLLYDIKNNKMLEVKDERFGVWRHDNIIIKNDLLLVVGGADVKSRVTGFFVLNLTSSTFKKAKKDKYNPYSFKMIVCVCYLLALFSCSIIYFKCYGIKKERNNVVKSEYLLNV